jgi:sporulation protein YlmC with PRC-barrel domain
MDNKHRTLFRLDEASDYKVDSDYSDVRGWKVIDADNNTIGKVDDLLFNKNTKRVVYIDVEVDKKLIDDGHEAYSTPVSEGAHEFLNKDGDNHLIIPIGAVTIQKDHKHVVSNELRYDTFKRANRFSKGYEIDREYENRVFGVYYPDDSRNTTHHEDDEFYNRSQFNRRD